MKYLLMSIALFFSLSGAAESNKINIYLDADFTGHTESSEAIQLGIELAFDEIDNLLEGYEVQFKQLDHRGNVVRSKRNYQTFIDDPDALVIYSGLHSPPLITNRDYINQEEALTLIPWAAGESITRYPSNINWIFRLSLDDSRAGHTIVKYALENQQCKHPHLLLEDTAWGDSNLLRMSTSLSENNVQNFSITRFSWNLKKLGARSILRDIYSSGNDCIILVANSSEAEIIIGELARLPTISRLPVISHWGIAGGSFPDVVPADVRESIELHFIYSCFTFTSNHLSQFAQQVFSRLTAFTNSRISDSNDLKSAVGFIHAYDLSRILIEAVKQSGISGNIKNDRNAVRIALENLKNPVKGLVKTYRRPFSVYHEDTNYDAHEALDETNYCIAEYGPKNEVLVTRN